MTGELIEAKKKWWESVEAHITSQGFQEVAWGYERIRIAQQPGQTISINGQVMQQPGREIQIKQSLYIQGDGWIANEDESNKMEFTQLRFETYQGEDLVMQLEEAFYWDNPDYFVAFFNQVFNR